jgi:uncharacterized protein YjbI with pentapeptide repeats
MTNRFQRCLNQILRTLLLLSGLAVLACAQDNACAVNPSNGNDYHGQTIVNANFAYRDLTDANFSNATLVSSFFAYANLANANFEGAVFVSDSSNASSAGDLSFSNLTGACFKHARFDWRSGITDLFNSPSGVPPAWYESDSTFIPAPKDPNAICNGQGADSAIMFW